MIQIDAGNHSLSFHHPRKAGPADAETRPHLRGRPPDRGPAVPLAREDGVSLNRWIATAVAQKVGAVETAAEFLRRKAGPATGADLGRLLDRVADGPPEPGDELPG